MNSTHDAIRYLSLLRQALEAKDRPIAVLLGAGCPVAVRTSDEAPLIPAIQGITTRVVESFERSTHAEHFATITQQLRRGLGHDPSVEEYLTHLRALDQVAAALPLGSLTVEILHAMDDEICNDIVELCSATLPANGTPYHQLAAWIRGTRRVCPIEVFTTNYDLLIEQALESALVPYFDGFIGSANPFFDPYAMESEHDALPARWARLWKLHGSINWWAESTSGSSRVVRSVDKAGERRLIHPSHLKYDEARQMPYVAMMDRLKAFLQRPSALLVPCGYSLRDRHINTLVAQALAGNADAIAFGLLRSELRSRPDAVRLAQRTANLTLLGSDGGVVGTQHRAWGGKCPDLPHAGLARIARDGADCAQRDEANATVTIGDFTQFGAMLAEIVGGDSQLHAEHSATGEANAD